MKRLLDIIALVAIFTVFLFLLAFLMVGSLLVPIDEGQELSRLATAGILRGAA